MKVKCVEHRYNLTKGKIYDVINTWESYGDAIKYTVINDLHKPETFSVDIFEKAGKQSQPWTKEVVFKTYCNDNLYELPLKILEQMRECIENIIDNKKEIE